MKTIAVSIDEDTLDNLDAVVAASRSLRSRSAVIRAAVREFAERERRRQAEEQERAVLRQHSRRLAREARALIREQAGE